MSREYNGYWGKADRRVSSGDDYHLLAYHSLDVAAVGSVLLDPATTLMRDFADFLEEDAELLSRLFVFVLALHDLGKFSSSFQFLYTENRDRLITRSSSSLRPYDARRYRHDALGWYFWPSLSEAITTETNIDAEFLETLALCSFGHHGQPIQKGRARELRRYREDQNDVAAQQFLVDLMNTFDIAGLLKNLGSLMNKRGRLEQLSWHIAGTFVLCDWIGSDVSHFPYNAKPVSDIDALTTYWTTARRNAEIAVEASGLRPAVRVAAYSQFEKEFGFPPTPLQAWAGEVQINGEPQLFLLEDLTGSGKTEAALTLVHRMLAQGTADGFYFGLPTMATSNAMFSRIAAWYPTLFESDSSIPSIVLAHGSRDMNERFQDLLVAGQPGERYATDDQSASQQCTAWLADSRKKALLAPIGVGTVDQALLATLPRRHQSLRLLGLHRKILVVDEVHAADEYMLELLIALLKAHKQQGGSCVLLSATLPDLYRKRVIAAWQSEGADEQCLDRSFPLATSVTMDTCASTSLRAALEKRTKVEFVHDVNQCIDQVLKAREKGQCAAWIRNSVNDALEAYRLLRERVAESDDIILFHSRFVLSDRQRIEAKVTATLGKEASLPDRRGTIVIATQVLQESLDIDLDVLVSDICPIDGLIQRAGRLHRHKRDRSGTVIRGPDERGGAVIYVHAPQWTEVPDKDWLNRGFRDTQLVYRFPGRLWLSMRILRQKGEIRLPLDARELIDQVYSEASQDLVPDVLKDPNQPAYGQSIAKSSIAKSRLIDWRYSYGAAEDIWSADDADIGTRFEDVESMQVCLVKHDAAGKLVPWSGTRQHAVRLSTVPLPVTVAGRLVTAASELQEFRHRYQVPDYLAVWNPECDDEFSYDSETGISKSTI